MADDLVSELRRQSLEIAEHARATLEEWTGSDPAAWLGQGRLRLLRVADEVQYRFDREVGRVMAEHPEVYAELRRGWRRLRRTWDKVAEDLLR